LPAGFAKFAKIKPKLPWDRVRIMVAISVSPQTTVPQWQVASWDDYLHLRQQQDDHPRSHDSPRQRLFFHAGCLLVKDMGWEGISHAQVKDLFILLLGLWFMAQPEQIAQSMSGCLMEKSRSQAAAPDLMLYVGEGCPPWEMDEPRRIERSPSA
jgi:hypothetical protein